VSSDTTTFVLVPGAWLGGWVWKKVAPQLIQKGHEVYPVTLTGMGDRIHLTTDEIGIETAIQDVLNVIKYNDLTRVVLIGHSFAGKVVASVADRVPQKITTLLYLDAFRPKKVTTPQGGFPDEFPVAGRTVPFPEKILDDVGKDIRGADREWLLSKSTPLPVKYFRDPITLTGNIDSVKKAYIFCTSGGDNVDQMLKETGPYKDYKIEGPYRIIDSGHWPMITNPNELVEDLLELSKSPTPQLQVS
jgi:pimeloyl-ACP methyl ester carboxylesterase